MTKNGTGKFLLAGILGAVAGTVGGLLLAPQSGRKTREKIAKLAIEISKAMKSEVNETKERVKDVFGKVSEEAELLYKKVHSSVASRVAAVKTAGEEISKEKYTKVVDEVVAEYKEDFKTTKDGITKMTGYLKKDWEKVKKALS